MACHAKEFRNLPVLCAKIYFSPEGGEEGWIKQAASRVVLHSDSRVKLITTPRVGRASIGGILFERECPGTGDRADGRRHAVNHGRSQRSNKIAFHARTRENRTSLRRIWVSLRGLCNPDEIIGGLVSAGERGGQD